MNVQLSPLRYLAVVSVCLLLAIFTVIPQCSPLAGRSLTSATAPQFLLQDMQQRTLLDTPKASGWRSAALGFPLSFNLAPAVAPPPSFKDNRQETGLVQLHEILTRLRRIFWTISQRWQNAVQATGILQIADANLTQKGDDMLENAT